MEENNAAPEVETPAAPEAVAPAPAPAPAAPAPAAPQAAPPAPAAETPPAPETPIPEADRRFFGTADDTQMAWAKDAYGATVAEKFQAAGINPHVLNEHWLSTGKIPESVYAALEAKAGLPRSLVQAYANGALALKNQATAEAVQMMQGEVDKVGGKDRVVRMQEWARTSFSPADLQAYNNSVASGDQAKVSAALGELQRRYEAVNGKPPQRSVADVRTHTTTTSATLPPQPPAEAGDVFASLAEVRAAQTDKRYGVDPAYTQAVTQKVVRSNLMGKARR